jgi:cysteinyl-tRNA synthetase
MQNLKVYNTLSKKKEEFEPLHPPAVGMYVCGPTVYGEAHLGHARSAITFDLVFRYLKHLGFRVRYVRNITDVGHLEQDADDGEDKIAKKARLEKLEPMEIAQLYTNAYHEDMDKLNVLRPSIEPLASGHIVEQLAIVKQIMDKGLAYESQGSIYFDVLKYNTQKRYGILSGRKLEDMVSGTRELDGQDEKRNAVDFALWKKAAPEHIMRWPSPWSEGFPGWHLECTAMSKKYLGDVFDIHGGGMDLLFPHHECEIAQSEAAADVSPAKYWLHNNMITINGQKMGKSLGNFITLKQFFSGDHPMLSKPYSPMTIRFFILQAHYRSTLDFSEEALNAAGKGLNKLFNGLLTANSLSYVEGNLDEQVGREIEGAINGFYEAMNDDFNSAIAISHLFTLLKRINIWGANAAETGKVTRSQFDETISAYKYMMSDILGLKPEPVAPTEAFIDIILGQYADAKAAKAYDRVDAIRQQLKNLGITVKDSKTGVSWAYND